jgi:hypothetical protein
MIDDKIYHYKPQGAGIEAHCRLRVFQVGITTAFMLTELPENRGMSVTNFAHGLATLLLDEYGVAPNDASWLEHYPADAARPQDTFDVIEFSWTRTNDVWRASNPQWRRVTMEEAEILTGANLSPMNRALGDLGFETVDGLDFDDWDAWEEF